MVRHRKRTSYKLVVRRLPRKVCVSIRAAKGRTLTHKKYVSRRKHYKVGKHRKTSYRSFMRSCMKRHKGRHYRGKGRKMGMCARRYSRGLKP